MWFSLRGNFCLYIYFKMKKLITELIETTKQINELNLKLIPLYNRQQILLVKLKKECNK